MAIEPKKPLSRKEMYLAKAAGEGDSVPDEPWSREEYYLSKIAEGGGGGGGPTVVQDAGTSTTSVISQDGTTKLIYPIIGDHLNGAIFIDPAEHGAPASPTDNDWGDVVGIGRNAGPSGSGSGGGIAIGANAKANTYGSALGYGAKGGYFGAAIGMLSEQDENMLSEDYGSVSVGRTTPTTYTDFSGAVVSVPAFTRRITNVSSPTNNSDVATKKYVDDNLVGNTFYFDPSEFNEFSSGTVSGVHIYRDAGLTTAATAGYLQQSLFNTGKAVFVVSATEYGTTTHTYFHLIGCSVPDLDSLASGNGMWIRCGFCGFSNKTFFFGTDSADPDQTAFDITVE